MSSWTEQEIRKAASWKAFKDGKDLFLAGAVTHAEANDAGWRGAVVSGRRPLRVAVQWNSASDVVCRCACPANQSSGEFCPHAVAVAMALLGGDRTGEPLTSAAPPQPVQPLSWSVRFAPNWMQTLSRHQLSIRLEAVDRQLHPADERLTAWVDRQAQGSIHGKWLQLRGAVMDDFISAIDEHPDLAVEGAGMLSVSKGARLAVRDAEPVDGVVHMEMVPMPHHALGVGQGLWLLGEGGMQAVGSQCVARQRLEQMGALIRTGRLSISVADLLRDLLSWQDCLDFAEEGWLRGLSFVAVEPEVRVDLDVRKDRVLARVRFRYPGGDWQIEGELQPQLVGQTVHLRSDPAEQAVLGWMTRAGFVMDPGGTGQWSLGGQDALGRFLADHPWPAAWARVESPAYEAFRKRVRVLRPSLQHQASGEDWLDFHIQVETDDGTQVAPEEVGRYLRGTGGTKAYLSGQWKQTFETLIDELASPLESGTWRARGAAAEVFRELCKNDCKSSFINGKQNLINAPMPPAIASVLRPYQRQGVDWMWGRLEAYQGAVLADDMGLGKTLQTIALVESLMAQDETGVALVVMTASLLGNWRAEWQKFAPGRRVLTLHGAERDSLRDQVRPGTVVLTTYGTLGRDLAWHLGRRYQVVVADEASLMRNPDTDLAKVMFKLDASRRLALTGTPMENGIRDLWSIFRFVQPGWLGSRKDFEERYPLTDAGVLPAAVMERLRWSLRPFLLRRTKEEVAPELPAKWVIDEFCDLSSRQRAVYRDLLVAGRGQLESLRDRGQAAAARLQVLTLLLRLRQSCGDLALLDRERYGDLEFDQRSGKLLRLMEVLDEAMQAGRRVLVFSQFREQLLRIEELVNARGWPSLRLDGQTTKRQALVDRFQAADGPPLFLISLKAGGYGLNLTAADMVVHVDPWWNPAVEAQATDRAHRIGQLKPVTVYRLLTRDTVEQKVVAMQERKRGLASLVDESGQESASDWSFGELEQLLAEV